MNYPYEYSEKEQQLISALNYESVAMSPSLPPTLLYNCLAVQCFRENRNDTVSDSVRRCLLALEGVARKDTVNPIGRLTKEFDDLIQL